MTDIDPAAVMAAHARHWRTEADMCCWSPGSDRCEPYRLAEALEATRGALENERWNTHNLTCERDTLLADRS